MIDLLMLGNGGMQPLPNRWLSSFLVRSQGSLILFDCGEGTQVPWKRFHWGFRRLDAICLTHHHADHVAGLPGVLHTVANAGRTEPLTIFGPPETERIVAGLRVIAPELPFDVVIRELQDDESFELPAGLRGRVRFGQHTMQSMAYRVDLPRARRFDARLAEASGVPQALWSALQHGETIVVDGREFGPDEVLGPPRRGVSLAFVTDTRPVAVFPDLARDVDLLICEGTYSNDDKLDKAHAWGHMSYREAAELARDSGAHRLWLTHFGSGNTDPDAELVNATRVFPETIAAYSGLTATLRFDQEIAVGPHHALLGEGTVLNG
ncbi:MAG TPA: ribonuclease Z [Thermomicrobiales bacterium]|nr:ribonuclease Z [Thermomicrobiales bacterium]